MRGVPYSSPKPEDPGLQERTHHVSGLQEVRDDTIEVVGNFIDDTHKFLLV